MAKIATSSNMKMLQEDLKQRAFKQEKIKKDADAMATIHKADLGYCNFLHFKCAGTRSCTAWVSGGAIDDKDRTQ